jgi:AAA15 family ATPase/GTPase
VLFCIAAYVVEALAKGGLVCVDELDASLHPLMAVEIVKMFNDPKRNPHNSQLLFNTHDTNILEYGDLRRDQVWFTEREPYTLGTEPGRNTRYRTTIDVNTYA